MKEKERYSYQTHTHAYNVSQMNVLCAERQKWDRGMAATTKKLVFKLQIVPLNK